MTGDPSLLECIDALARRTLAESEAEGMTLGIATRDGARILRTYGAANRDAEIPVTESTLFEIGSISKSFLAIVLMQLAADGMIDLHAPVSDYLPWFSVQSAFAPITAHHLLSHTAGLPTGFAHRPDSLWELWELRHVRPGEPGAYWHYSDVGYSLLGALVETVLVQPFDQILTERVLAPLGFTNSTASVTTGQRSRLAQGYKRHHDERPWHSGDPVYPATWMETSSGAGSIVMDVSDMLGYAEFLRRTWNGGDSGVLTSAQLRAMVDPAQLPAPAADEHYGYGLYWRAGDAGEIVFLGHGGDMVGYESGIGVDLANGICVVWLANGAVADYGFRDEVSALVAAAKAGEPLAELPDETLRAYIGAGEWVGRWRSWQRTIDITIGEEGLELSEGDNWDERIPLQRYSRQSRSYLATSDPAWNRFLFEADRGEGDDGALGPIVAIHHGGETFVRDGQPLPEGSDYPAEWDGYAGFYRSYNPWYPAVRVVHRNGALWLFSSYGDGSELVPEGAGFRVGAEPPNFDYLIFTPIIDGRAEGIRFETGAEYSRFFAE